MFAPLFAALLSAPLALGGFVTPEQAQALLPRAVVVDARPSAEFLAGHLPSAHPLDWHAFISGGLGRLRNDDVYLARLLEQAGVDGRRPVLIYGDPEHGWGEEG